MKYDITKPTAPKMPTLGKGTECLQILLSQVSKSMHAPLIPMLFPVLGAQVSNAEFQYPDLTWKELCGQMANLVAESGGNKGQLTDLTEAICRDFRQHDEPEMNKLREWAKISNSKSKSKDGPVKPDAPIFLPPANTTRAGFLLNAMGCETLGGRTQYFKEAYRWLGNRDSSYEVKESNNEVRGTFYFSRGAAENAESSRGNCFSERCFERYFREILRAILDSFFER